MNNPTNGNRVIDSKMLIASRMLDARNVNSNRRYIRKLNKLSEKLSRKDNNLVIIYEPESVVSELKKTCTHERKTNLRAMRDDEPNEKPLALVSEQIIDDVLRLKDKFPNFSEVIELYSMAMRLNLFAGVKKLSLRPLLLVGEPGVGKTRFLSELGKVLKTNFFSIDMSRVSAGFILSGSDSTWSSGKPGFISNSMRSSNVANPLILIDEIDKVRGDSRYDPSASFYALLEQHTAKEFNDEFLNVPMNCSHINWVASANYPDRIEPAILSRMQVVRVDMPTPEQTVPIVRNIYSELLINKNWYKAFDSCLSDDVADSLKNLSPRMVVQLLENACYKAFKRRGDIGRKCSLSPYDIELPIHNKKTRIGFITD